MADRRTLKQRIHDSEVKWDCYMRALAWAKDADKESILWWLREKMDGHATLLDRYAYQDYRWWHRLLGVKRPNPPLLVQERTLVDAMTADTTRSADAAKEK